MSILRIVPETQAAERRMWNSNPSEETRVTKADGVEEVEVEVEALEASAAVEAALSIE